jgi:hypothetical protein
VGELGNGPDAPGYGMGSGNVRGVAHLRMRDPALCAVDQRLPGINAGLPLGGVSLGPETGSCEDERVIGASNTH